MKSIQDPSFSARQNTKPLQNELQGFCADGGGRTRTPVRAGDFKSENNRFELFLMNFSNSVQCLIIQGLQPLFAGKLLQHLNTKK